MEPVEQVQVEGGEGERVGHDTDPAALERFAQTIGVEEGHRDGALDVELLLRTPEQLAERDQPGGLRVTVVV